MVISCFSETSEHQGSRGKKKKSQTRKTRLRRRVLTGDTKNQNKITFSKERRQHGELSQSCGHSTLRERNGNNYISGHHVKGTGGGQLPRQSGGLTPTVPRVSQCCGRRPIPVPVRLSLPCPPRPPPSCPQGSADRLSPPSVSRSAPGRPQSPPAGMGAGRRCLSCPPLGASQGPPGSEPRMPTRGLRNTLTVAFRPPSLSRRP